MDSRIITAVNNNADLYSAIFDAHGLRYTRTADYFLALDVPPSYYSSLVLLSDLSAKDLDALLAQIPKYPTRRRGFKDSFHRHSPIGFAPLFSASWIWRDPPHAVPPTDWHPVRTPADLTAWETAWKCAGSPTDQTMFPPALLKNPDLTFWAQTINGQITAGCIANRSPNCIGLSNVFSCIGGTDHFAQATDAAASVAPSMPLTGYESGPELELAKQAGFTALAPLRIQTEPAP